jgi:hypothetical protein
MSQQGSQSDRSYSDSDGLGKNPKRWNKGDRPPKGDGNPKGEGKRAPGPQPCRFIKNGRECPHALQCYSARSHPPPAEPVDILGRIKTSMSNVSLSAASASSVGDAFPERGIKPPQTRHGRSGSTPTPQWPPKILGGHCLQTTAELTLPLGESIYDDGLAYYNRAHHYNRSTVDGIQKPVGKKLDVLRANVEENAVVPDQRRTLHYTIQIPTQTSRHHHHHHQPLHQN